MSARLLKSGSMNTDEAVEVLTRRYGSVYAFVNHEGKITIATAGLVLSLAEAKNLAVDTASLDKAKTPTVAAPWTPTEHYGATEDQVNMRGSIPQRIDRRGTKVEDLAGTGQHDSQGG